MPPSNMKSSILQLQKQLVELQRATAQNSLDMMVNLQEQQKQLAISLVDRSPLPDEAKEAYETWLASLSESRDQLRAASERSFDLLEAYLERAANEDSQE